MVVTAREQCTGVVGPTQAEQPLLSSKVMGLRNKHLLTVWLMKRNLLVAKREKGENHT